MEEILDNSATGSVERVAFGPRLGAFVLDIVFSIVLGLILVPVGAAIGGGVGSAAGDLGGTDEQQMMAAAGGFIGMLMGAIVMIYLAIVL